ncbi:MAG: hypothetical protein ABI882_10970, partial [Acidobacteriota bacterium]
MNNKLTVAALILIGICATGSPFQAQEKKAPITKAEILAALKQGPERRSSQGDLAEEISVRGLGFKLDDAILEEFRQAGAKSFLLEAIRRTAAPRLQQATPQAPSNPQGNAPASPSSGSPSQPVAEARDPLEDATPEEREAALAKLPLIEQARWHSLEYMDELPNFSVTQLVSRYEKTSEDRDWKLLDTLEIELSYRIKEGEKFKLLKVNGAAAKTTYEQLGGSTSTGEFGLLLGALFSPASHAQFTEIKTEKYRGYATAVFDFRVKKVDSTSYITDKITGKSMVAGYTGTVWIDKESKKVLRVELSHEQIPTSFPVSLAENAVEY